MRHSKFINTVLNLALILGIVLTAAGCHRRPLHEADYGVRVNINIEKDIVNYTYPGDPEVMRVVFYDHESGSYVTQAFVGPKGGDVYVLPEKTYDVLVYNFDTESTLIREGDYWDRINATTNDISDQYRNQVRTRASQYPQVIRQALETKGEISTERFVYDPDHLYVGRKDNVYVPARAVEMPILEINIDAVTVVESWIVDVATIKGIENIGSVSAVMSGLAESNNIGPNVKSTDIVTVYFDQIKIDNQGVLIGRFNTFGANLNVDYPRVLSLIFIDTAGGSHVFNFDVSEQFVDNPKQYIKIRTEIVIPDPPVGPTSGGLAPVVDEWSDVYSFITI